jgi:pimeloyl-ACP methyl ester carboxylesterase
MEFSCFVCSHEIGRERQIKRKGNVLFLHGFPLWASTFKPIQERLCELSYRTLACNQRGYSLHASPDGIKNYAYAKIRSDAWALANARSFETFHLVAHDHGAVLGWWMVASPTAKDKILSYSALSIPHLVPFSESLGDEGSQQVVQSQYFLQFVKPEAVDFFWPFLGDPAGFSQDQFQKALWWYNGAFDAGILTLPKQLSASDIRAKGEGSAAPLFAMFQDRYGGSDLKDTVPASNPISKVSMPVLFVCGKNDVAILCDTPYTKKTEDWATAGYTELVVPGCEHNPLGTLGHKCAPDSVKATVEAIEKNIVDATPR